MISPGNDTGIIYTSYIFNVVALPCLRKYNKFFKFQKKKIIIIKICNVFVLIVKLLILGKKKKMIDCLLTKQTFKLKKKNIYIYQNYYKKNNVHELILRSWFLEETRVDCFFLVQTQVINDNASTFSHNASETNKI